MEAGYSATTPEKPSTPSKSNAGVKEQLHTVAIRREVEEYRRTHPENKTKSPDVDVSKISAKVLVGSLDRYTDQRLWVFGGPDRKVGRDMNWEFVQYKNGQPMALGVRRLNGGEMSTAQIMHASDFLQNHAFERDEKTGQFKQFVPQKHWNGSPTDPDGLGLWDNWGNVGVAKFGWDTRVTADSVRTPEARQQLDAALRKEIQRFLRNKNTGDYFPIYIFEPNGLTDGLNSSTNLRTKVLYIKREDLKSLV